MERINKLEGKTYKVKPMGVRDAFYITINNIFNEENKEVPYELFCNTKNLTHVGTLTTITVLVSKTLKLGADVGGLIKDLVSIYDPAFDGYHDKEYGYVQSVSALLGRVLEKHVKELNRE